MSNHRDNRQPRRGVRPIADSALAAALGIRMRQTWRLMHRYRREWLFRAAYEQKLVLLALCATRADARMRGEDPAP